MNSETQNPYQTSQTVSKEKRSWLVPFLVALLFVVGLLGGLGFYALQARAMAARAEDQARQAMQAADALAEQAQLQTEKVE